MEYPGCEFRRGEAMGKLRHSSVVPGSGPLLSLPLSPAGEFPLNPGFIARQRRNFARCGAAVWKRAAAALVRRFARA
jgi:hypothetical protein